MLDRDFAEELKRLDEAASSYAGLGSTQIFPIALYAWLLAAITGGWIDLSLHSASLVGGLGLLLAIGSYWLIAWSNCAHYGATRDSWPDGESEITRWVVAWVGAAAYVLVAIAEMPWPVSFVGVLAGASLTLWLLVRWRRTGTIGAQSYSLLGLLIIGSLCSQSNLGTSPVHVSMFLALIGGTLLAIAITVESRLVAATNSQKEG